MASLQTGAAIQASGRSDAYYAQPRPEVADLVPAHCRRVLEVGCAEGHLGELLRSRGHEVVGIELVPEIAERARDRLDLVVTADVEADGFPFAKDSFDAILFADVLEHLVDPWRVLREAVEVLHPRGVVIVSIPNVQNIAVVWRLLRGSWDYRERGILDRGHLRFFTLKTIRKLFDQAGLSISHVGYRYRRNWWRGLVIFLTAGWARALHTRQYLVVGQRRKLLS